jgi:uncharacterized protein (DUF1800 family)
VAVAWNPVNAAYLLRRAGFGPTAAEVEEHVALGLEGAVSRLVDYETVDNSALDTRLTQLGLNLDQLFDLYFWWVYRMLYTARPLEEKLTLFWHGHFATSFAKVNDTRLLLRQNELFRRLATGDFEEMLVEVSKDPAMLIWLDNFLSVKEAPNENYGRELVELFSLGIGNYTETDVKEIARCFTGWTLSGGFEFAFVAGIHDTGAKAVLGNAIRAGRGIEDGLEVCRILADHPVTAAFLARKLWRFFAAGEVPERVLDAMTSAYEAGDHSIREMLRVVFTSEEFYARAVTDEQIKSPTELFVGTLRTLEADRNIVEFAGFRFFIYHTLLMGQTLFLPPNVKGWDGGRKWINTSTLLARDSFASAVATTRGPGYQLVDVGDLVGRSGATTAEEVVDAFAELLGPLDVGTAARRRLADYLRARPDGTPGEFSLDDGTIDTKVRGLLVVLLSSPEYQMHLKGRDPGLVAPAVVSPAYKNGKLIVGAEGASLQPGARVRVTGEAVDGTESFALEQKSPKKWVVAKRATSAPGGHRLGDLAARGAALTLVIENPDGGQSEPYDLTV